MDKTCKTCFYAEMDKRTNPCITCSEFSKWVDRGVYIHRPDALQIEAWEDEYVLYSSIPGTIKEDFDIVNKPKHYMLFEKEGIEVRDVIAKLVSKIPAGECMTVPKNWDTSLFVSDYVQMMQYLMRFMDKGGKQDLEKGLWYLNKVIASYEPDF